MRTRGLPATCTVALVVALLPVPAARAVDVALVTGDDVGWRHPQATDDHRVVVLERFRDNSCLPSPTCRFPRFHDVGVLDLGATCAQDVLRLVTHDGVSHDPSVSADGATIAFWREEAAGGFSIIVQATDGSGTPTVFAEPSSPDEIDHLDLSPDGRHVTWWRRTGGTEEVVILDAQAVPPALVASDSASDVILGDQRPIDSSGRVVYSKLVGALHQLHRVTPAGVVTSLDVAGVEELEASQSADGAVVAFVGVASGIQNVWVGSSQRTFNGDPAAGMAAVAVSGDGSWVAFHSQADLVASNPDDTWEIYRVTSDGATLEQVTSITPPPPFGDVLLDRVTLSAAGDVLLWGQAKCSGSCTALSSNELDVRIASPTVTAPMDTPVNEVVRPPFDVVTDVGGIAPAPGCSRAGSTVTCVVVVRASTDAARDVAVQSEWILDDGAGPCPDVVRPSAPVVVRLSAGRQLVLSQQVTPACRPTSVTHRVRAVGGELGGQPDFSLLTGETLLVP